MRVVFGEFALDSTTRQLLRGEELRHLERKAFQLLELLVSRRPAAVPKPEIRDRLWPDTFVSESSLTRLVTQIRHALEDDSRRPRFVRTLHDFGYAFVARAEEAAPEAPSRSSRDTGLVRPVVLWEDRSFPLDEGENVLGRDDGLAVTLRWSGVSRRHARIVVTGGLATLEDLGSKNGTFLRGERLTQPASLADGDTFRLGRLFLVFSVSSGAVSTRTETFASGHDR
jgi:DNA-binding winged helix-turn-helix (wHTH) protein